MRHGNLFLLAGAALCASIGHAAPNWKYTISDIEVVDLGTMGGKESVAHDINDQGEIVGWSDTQGSWHHGFLRRGGSMQDITPFEGYEAEAHGINNFTKVVGYLRHLSSDAPHAFHWDDRTSLNLLHEAYADLNAYKYCASGGDAKAINDSGVITGFRLGGCNPPVAYVERASRWASWMAPWEEIKPLGNAPKSNSAFDINSAGKIVGENRDAGIGTGAFHWSLGSSSDVPFPSVTAPAWPEDSSMKAFGINDDGSIVGTVTVREYPKPGESTQRAYFWNGLSAQASLLPTLSEVGYTAAFEINDQGFSVGYGDNRDRWGVVWHAHIGATSLKMPPGAGSGPLLLNKHCEALAVNNRSSIGLVQAVGYCVVGGDRHAVLWNITTKKVTTL